MKFIKIFLQLVLIYGFFLLGQGLREFFNLPLPGSIIGFLLLFAALIFKIFPIRWVESGAVSLLAFLPLYFIPATVGVIDYRHIFTGKGIWLIAILIASTLLTMAVSGYASQYMARHSTKRKEQS